MSGRTVQNKLIALLLCILCAEALCLSLIHLHSLELGDTSVSRSIIYQPQIQTGAPILLLGTDAEGLRTDVIMLFSVRESDSTPMLLSIPRDSMVQLDGSVEKINAVYAIRGGGTAGVSALKSVLDHQFSVLPANFILVDLTAFELLVDAVGGIVFDVPLEMHYADPTQDLQIDLSPGNQRLSGAQALGLVRYRNYFFGDIDRTKMQQSFLRTAAKQVVSEMTPKRLLQLCALFQQYVQTDLSLSQMVNLARKLSKCNYECIQCETLPGDGVRIGCIDYYCLYDDEAKAIIDTMFNDIKK